MWAKLFSYLWLLLFIALGILALYGTPKRIKESIPAIEKEISPYIAYINFFQKENNKLPSEIEFKKWQYIYLNHNIDTAVSEDSLRKLIDSNGEMDVTYIRTNKDFAYISKMPPTNVDWNNNYVVALWKEDGDAFYTSWDHVYTCDTNYEWTGSILFFAVMLVVGYIPLIAQYIRGRNPKVIQIAE